MANKTDCLIGLLGVTQKDCSCIENILKIEGTPADVSWYKKSTSGYYLDELEGMVSIDAVKDVVSCEKLSDFYKKVINNAIRDTADDVAASINEKYQKRGSDFVGFIGAKSSRSILNIDGAYAGMKISVDDTAGGVLVIKGIGTVMNMAATFDVTVYRRYVDTDLYELVDTIESVTSIGGYKENLFEEPLILPMQIDNESYIEYYFLYSTAGGLLPRNNDASCGCGKKERDLKKLISYGGVSGDEISAMGSWQETDYANGIVLDAEVRCDAENILCKMFNVNAEWGKYLSHAVLYKAAWKIHKEVLSSNHITQDIMANRETVADNMNNYDTEYWSRVRYLVQNVDIKLNDCYVCGNRNLRVTQILL